MCRPDADENEPFTKPSLIWKALDRSCFIVHRSYPVWFHRQWVIEWGRCSWQWARELKLTAKLLALDDRNFHCWTYRRFVAKVAGESADAELNFTTSKIEQNFSNYSAWHYRSKLLPAIFGTVDDAASAGAIGGELRARLLEELQLVRNAFFTAPEDSSAWFYHRWVLAKLDAIDAAGAPPSDVRRPSPEHTAVLSDELAMIEDLLELEPESKWPLAAAVFLGKALAVVRPGSDERVSEHLRSLQRVDPTRVQYYAHLLDTVTSSALS